MSCATQYLFTPHRHKDELAMKRDANSSPGEPAALAQAYPTQPNVAINEFTKKAGRKPWVLAKYSQKGVSAAETTCGAAMNIPVQREYGTKPSSIAYSSKVNSGTVKPNDSINARARTVIVLHLDVLSSDQEVESNGLSFEFMISVLFFFLNIFLL